MFHLTTTATNTLLRAYDEGNDIMVVISGNKPKPDEHWFSRHTGRSESFREGGERVFTLLADEMETTIMPIV